MSRSKRATPRRRAVRSAKESEATKNARGAIVSDVMQRASTRTVRTRDEAIDADVSVVNRILWEASTGKTARLIDLYKSSRTRDSRLDAVCRTRVLAMRSRPLIFRPPTGLETDSEAKAFVELTTRIFDAVPGRGDLIGHLGHGALEGFAVAEHRWHEVSHPTRKSGTVVTSTPRWRHSNRFGWNTQTIELCRCDPGVDSFPGRPLSDWPGKFITHAPVIGDSDYPWYRGALRSRAIASVIKRLVMRWWLKGIERWGQSQVWVAADEDLRDGVGDEIMSALRDLSSAWHARFPKGTEVNAIPGKIDAQVHDAWVQFHATEDAIAILGQNLTTEVQGGSFAAAQAHMLVRLDYLAADLAALAETIRDQWLSQLFLYNGWPSELIPQVDFVLAPKGEITVAHYLAGLFTADEVRGAMGADPEPNGEGSRRSAQAGIPQGTAVLPVGGAPTAAGPAPAADAALNGAQIDSLKGFAADVQAGALPRDAAYELATIAFPGVDPVRLKSAFDKLVPGSLPPDGGGAPPPFPQSAKPSPTMTAPSPTNWRSRHPLATSLSQR